MKSIENRLKELYKIVLIDSEHNCLEIHFDHEINGTKYPVAIRINDDVIFCGATLKGVINDTINNFVSEDIVSNVEDRLKDLKNETKDLNKSQRILKKYILLKD